MWKLWCIDMDLIPLGINNHLQRKNNSCFLSWLPWDEINYLVVPDFFKKSQQTTKKQRKKNLQKPQTQTKTQSNKQNKKSHFNYLAYTWTTKI